MDDADAQRASSGQGAAAGARLLPEPGCLRRPRGCVGTARIAPGYPGARRRRRPITPYPPRHLCRGRVPPDLNQTEGEAHARESVSRWPWSCCWRCSPPRATRSRRRRPASSRGTVTAESKPVAAASVIVTNTATNFEKTLTTGADGRFRGVLLPLGPYRITVELDGFANLVREGIDLARRPDDQPRAGPAGRRVSEEITVTGEAPVIETSRTEGTVASTPRPSRGCPTTAATSSTTSSSRPASPSCRAPTATSCRSTARRASPTTSRSTAPTSTTPSSASSAAASGRPSPSTSTRCRRWWWSPTARRPSSGAPRAASSTSSPSRAPTSMHGSAHGFFNNDSLSTRRRTPTAARAEEGNFDRKQGGFTLGGPLRAGQALLLRRRRRAARDPHQADQPQPHGPAAGLLPRHHRPARRERPHRAHRRRRGGARQDRLAGLGEQPLHLPLQLHQLRADQRHLRRRPVGPLGQRRRAGLLARRHRQPDHAPCRATCSTRCALQYAKEWRPRPYEGPNIPGQSRPFPDTAILFNDDFTPTAPAGACRSSCRSSTTTTASSSPRTSRYLRSNHSFKVGLRLQRGHLLADLHRLRQRPLRLPHHRATSSTTYNQRRRARHGAALPAAGGRRPHRRSRRPGTQTSSRRSPRVYVQDQWHAARQPHHRLRPALGGRSTIPSVRHAAERGVLRPLHRPDPQRPGVPLRRRHPDDWEMWQPRLGISWAPDGDGKSVVRVTAGIFNARLPALNLASTRSTNGSLGQTLFRNSALAPILGPPPPYTAAHRRRRRAGVLPRRLRLRQGLADPAHHRRTASRTSAR